MLGVVILDGNLLSEGKRKRQTQAAMLESELRCIYCESVGPLTIEHMPPRSMFKGSQRPKGMEFAACESCNNGTRACDALMAMIARIGPDMPTWKTAEFQTLVDTLSRLAPDTLAEIAGGKKTHTFTRFPDGLYRPIVNVDVEGPAVAHHAAAFVTKLGMAAFRELTGNALPLDGAVWTHWVFNGGMTPEKLSAMTSIMPLGATLTQGKTEVSEQFYYRYNSDGATTIAVTAGFHGALWMMAIASSHSETVEGLKGENRLWPSAIAQPGGLRDLLAGGGPLGRLMKRKGGYVRP